MLGSALLARGAIYELTRDGPLVPAAQPIPADGALGALGAPGAFGAFGAFGAIGVLGDFGA